MTNAFTISVIERARHYLGAIPGAVSGAGGHNQTFVATCALVHGFALDEATTLDLLREYNQKCSPPWTERELQHKVVSAMRAVHSKPRGYLLHDQQVAGNSWLAKGNLRPKTISRIDPCTSVENFLKGFRCDEVDLWEASPIRPPDDWTQDTIALLEHLYLSGERINFVTAFKLDTKEDGTTKAIPAGYGTTLEREKLITRFHEQGAPHSEAGGWLRMNPLNAQGVGDSEVNAFRFALIECDTIPLDLQLPLLAKLPLPIGVILTSGGRSLHAWVKVDAATLDDYRNTVAPMLQLLGRFGVDTQNKNPSRLSRLPGVIRSIGAQGDGRQRLLYLNPQPKQKAIL